MEDKRAAHITIAMMIFVLVLLGNKHIQAITDLAKHSESLGKSVSAHLQQDRNLKISVTSTTIELRLQQL